MRNKKLKEGPGGRESSLQVTVFGRTMTCRDEMSRGKRMRNAIDSRMHGCLADMMGGALPNI